MKIRWLLLLIFLAAVTSALLLQYRSLVGLRVENESLRQQLKKLQSDYERGSRSPAQAADPRPDDELLRLRGEVTVLHDQLNRQAARKEQDHGNLQAPQQPTLSAVFSESNNLVTWLSVYAGPDALSRGTVTVVTNKFGRTNLEYRGTDAEGHGVYVYRFGPTNR